ncbi:MAG TPA: PBP1A family penicillin-binding protein [Terriglobia bacterium]
MRVAGDKVGRWKNVLLGAGVACFVISTVIFVSAYVQFSGEIDARLSGQVFNRASMVFSAPTPITVGETVTPEEVAARLRRGLYSQGESGSKVGTYTLAGDRLAIRPGPLSYFAGQPAAEGAATVEFEGRKIASITVDGEESSAGQYLLEPEPITTLFDQSRTKRRLIRYQDLPAVLVNAVLAAEDRRFFFHHGVNFYRIIDAAFKDVRADERLQGGSTLTMQLARNFFLTPKRTVGRKIQEIFLALVLEQRLSKEQIFELYANEVYLGQRGSFSIDGFAAASESYFNKDVKSLTLPEAALLAALIRGPNLYSPYRHPQQALRVRNYVVREMQDDDFISADQAQEAAQSPLGVAPQNVEGSQAPFFVDMVKDQLLERFSETDLISQSYRVYTALDPDLQRVASEAVKSGMAEVDAGLSRRRHKKDEPPRDPNQPQVAMVVLDPHSGEVRALVGGRDYAVSQLNHALAKRQPGSSFKPFVYAAALSSAVNGSQPLVTPATILMDEPTTFEFDNRVYEPRNYKEEYHGPVTLREALSYSLNCATVSLAQMIGYSRVRDLAVDAGINRDLLATPALALGSYDATPLEIADAYTIFANSGEYASERLILKVRDDSGRDLWQPEEARKRVLDPRVAYQMVNLMETVIDHGTGAGVRSRGFALPAAGKTGTSHDGWFAGFTTNLLAVVWVGYDDNRELGLPGANSALPVWTNFMKAATALPDYRDAHGFSEPPGLITASIQLPPISPGDTAPLAAYPEEVFIEGTEPHGSLAILGGMKGVFSRLLGLGGPSASEAGKTGGQPAQSPQIGTAYSTDDPSAQTAVGDPPEASKDKKRPGVVKRIFSIFKRGGSKQESPLPEPKEEDNSNNPE